MPPARTATATSASTVTVHQRYHRERYSWTHATEIVLTGGREQHVAPPGVPLTTQECRVMRSVWTSASELPLLYGGRGQLVGKRSTPAIGDEGVQQAEA